MNGFESNAWIHDPPAEVAAFASRSCDVYYSAPTCLHAHLQCRSNTWMLTRTCTTRRQCLIPSALVRELYSSASVYPPRCTLTRVDENSNCGWGGHGAQSCCSIRWTKSASDVKIALRTRRTRVLNYGWISNAPKLVINSKGLHIRAFELRVTSAE